MNHNTAIIVAISIVITLLLLIYSTRIFLSDSSSGTTGINNSVDLPQIETLLKQVLEKSHNVKTSAEISGASQVGSPGEDVLNQIKKLEEELKVKQAEIEAAKNQTTGIDPEEKLKLEGRIRELEAKLTEYEIIAEDIADLSRFKEENAVLKKKIEELENATDNLSRDLTRQQSASSTSTDTSSKLASASPSDSGATIDDDLMAEFAKAVEQQKQQKAQPRAVTTESDVLGHQVVDVDLASILNEAASLTEPPPDAKVVNPIEQELNSEQLAAEALSLDQVAKPEDIEIMNNFEQFVKGR
jgi:hypothetical protein